MRFSRQAWAVVAAVAMVLMVSQVALAQREEGRRGGRGGRGFFGGGRGGGMISALQLASNADVQKALKVTDEQADKIKDINDAMRDERRKLFEGGRDAAGDQAAMREKMQELTATATKKLNEVLDATQQKRLMGIQIQVSGANAVMDPAIGKELNVTEDQKKKLEEVSQSNRDAMRELFEGARDAEGGPEAMREKMEKQREEANKKLMAVLTSDQQAQLETLKGEKVEIDMASLRGPDGGRFGDRQRGQRGERGNRGQRNQGERNPEANN
jgi:Spy/CpxP family protein refolding chaperone